MPVKTLGEKKLDLDEKNRREVIERRGRESFRVRSSGGNIKKRNGIKTS